MRLAIQLQLMTTKKRFMQVGKSEPAALSSAHDSQSRCLDSSIFGNTLALSTLKKSLVFGNDKRPFSQGTSGIFRAAHVLALWLH